MRKSTCLLPKVIFTLAFGLALTIGQPEASFAQDDVLPSSSQSGSFFNRQLGTALRFNYHTRGYGTQDDVFSLGGMKVFNMDGATAFIDGQGTLSDDFGGGFNLGAGYRQLTTLGLDFDPQRIMGASFWTDGQSSANDNFFTQLGFSLESLGDAYDIRFSGYFPLDRTKTGDVALTGSGTPFYSGNNIFGATESFGVDTALDVLDLEGAVRVADLEAWAFAGAYYVGGGANDTAGYRAGMRGYALPDLAVSASITDDDIYDTNFLFGITWFIGRTHKGNAPCGTLLDRFREPVIRNDFIAMETGRVDRQSGDALTSPTDDEAIRVVHVNSGAAAGGDGTFENPFDQISDVDASLLANSMEGDIILVHGGSSYAGADAQATFQPDQIVLGEGVDQDMNAIPHVVATNELGNINLPETVAGAQMGPRPTISAAGLTPFTLADNNTINNFTINGTGAETAVLADTVATPTLQNLQINDVATGLDLRDITGTAVVENTVQINRASAAAVNVFGGTDGMSIAATINASTGNSLRVQGRTGGTVDFTGTVDDTMDEDMNPVATNSQGILIGGLAAGEENVDATVNLTNALNLRVAGTDNGLGIVNNENTIVNASGTFEIASAGTANGIFISENEGSTVNASGTFEIDAADTSNGMLVSNNLTTTVDATGMFDVRGVDTANGVVIANGDTGSTVTFADLNATAVDGNTVDVRQGGTVTITSDTTTDPDRRIANTGTGIAFFNEGDLLNADLNAAVTVNSNILNSGGGLAVQVQNRLEGDVTFAGTIDVSDGMSGGLLVQDNEDGIILFSNALTLDTGTGDAVTLLNNENAVTMATISFADLDIDTTSGDGFTAMGGGNLIVTSLGGTNNIDVMGTGVALTLDGMTIDPANVTFNEINSVGGTEGIVLRDLEGTGQVFIGGGFSPGDGGMLSTTGQAITIDNVPNVSLANLMIGETGTPSVGPGLLVTRQMAGSNVAINNLEVTTSGAGHSVNVTDNLDGTITFNTLAATSEGTGDAVRLSNNLDATVAFNDMTTAATGGGTAFNATGSGNLSVLGTNSASATGGSGVVIADQTIVGGATFQTVDVSGGTNGVSLTNVDGALVTIGSGTTVGDGGTLSTTGTAIEVNNVDSVAVNNMIVDNDTGPSIGQGVLVTNQDTGSTATFNTLTVRGTTNTGVNVNGNQDGTIIFNDLEATTTAGTAISVVGNNNATTTFSNMDVTTTGGVGFSAAGTGTLVATRTAGNTNDISTDSGQAISMVGTEIGVAGFTVDTVNVAAGTGTGVGLTDVSVGPVTLGSGTNAGDGGTIVTAVNAPNNAMSISNVENLTVTNINLQNTGTGGGLSVTNQAAGSDANFNTLVATAVAGDAVNVSGNTDGTIDFTDLDASTTGTGGAVVLSNNNAATVSINGMTAAATGTGAGFSATGSGNLAVGGTTSIDTTTGKALEIVGQNISAASNFDTVNMTGTIDGTAIELRDVTGSLVSVGSGTTAGDGGTVRSEDNDGLDEEPAILVDNVASLTMENIIVDNAATNGRGIEVRNNAAGTRTFDGMVVTTGTNAGSNIDIYNNSGGTTTFNNVTADSSIDFAHAIQVRDNTAGTVNVATATVTSDLGDGFRVTNNGNTNVNLSNFDVTTGSGDGLNIDGTGNVTTTGTNTITAATGIGINVTNAENATIANVTVDANGANAVNMSHTAATASDVALNNVTINDGTQGINISANGTGEFDITMDELLITGVDTEAITFDTGASADRVDLTLTDSNITAGDASAFAATLNDSNTADVRFVIDDNIISNNSGTAGNDRAALQLDLTSGMLLSARIGNLINNENDPPLPLGDSNRITNGSADGDPLRVTVNDGILNLDLRDNTALGGTIEFSLTNDGGTFNLVDAADTLAGDNNVGTVVDTGPDPIVTTAPPILAPTP